MNPISRRRILGGLMATAAAAALAPMAQASTASKLLVLGKRATPRTIFGANLKGWWQTDSVLNTRNGSAFANLKDLSGHGFDLAQGNAPSQPPVGAAAINGHDCVEFDGGAHVYYMSTAGAAQPGQASPYYLFGIVKPRANITLAQNRLWFCDITGSAKLDYRDDGAPTTILRIYAGGAAAEQGTVINGNVYAFTSQFNDTASFLRLNRSAKTATGAQIGTNAFNQATIGTGGGFGVNDCADGFILEVGIVAGIPTAAQDDACNAYLISPARANV